MDHINLQKNFKRADKMPKRKTFFYIISLKKMKELKSNQKSHLINFKLILLRTNQNSVFKIGRERASLHFFCVFRVFFFFFLVLLARFMGLEPCI